MTACRVDIVLPEMHDRDATSTHSRLMRDLPDGWDEEIPAFAPEGGPLATRASSGKVLEAIAR